MFLKVYLIAIALFFAIDLLWLGVVAKNFYREQIGFLLRDDVNWWAAIVFYLIFLVGLAVFVILPGLERGSVSWVIGHGALFGLVTYAAYDLTNLATTKNWPLTVTVVDLAWGAVLAASVSTLTYLIVSKW